mmetsp:Transcript_83210/g.178383  ORF Transcript_83210/g.178383 Transcript_83210/m.178383 type:complete len:565 (+) Transcript_83210:130-1824(+)
MEPADPPSSRTEGSTAPHQQVLDWGVIARSATGCGPEYIPRGGERGMRLLTTGFNALPPTSKRTSPSGDSTLMMQEGVPVLFYHPIARVFEQRVLKVDTKLRFLFVLLDSANVKSSLYQDPIVLRLRQIALIHGTDMAMNLCQTHNVSDSELDAASAVVVQSRTDQETPPFEKLMIFLAPPQLHLKAVLEDCVRYATHHQLLAGHEAAIVEPLTSSADERHLDGLRLKEVPSLFAIDSKVLNFEIAFRSQGTEGDRRQSAAGSRQEPHIYPVRLPLQPEACEKEVAKMLTKVGRLPQIDAARMTLALQEMATIRQWVQACSRTVDVSFYRLLIDERSAATVAKLDFQEAKRICDPPPRTVGFSAADELGGAALRAITRALKQFLHLERMHADLSRRAPLGASSHHVAFEAPEKVVLEKMVLEKIVPDKVGLDKVVPDKAAASATSRSQQAPAAKESESAALLASKETPPAPNRPRSVAPPPLKLPIASHSSKVGAPVAKEGEEREQAMPSSRSSAAEEQAGRSCEPNSLLEQLSKYKWASAGKSRSCASGTDSTNLTCVGDRTK